MILCVHSNVHPRVAGQIVGTLASQQCSPRINTHLLIVLFDYVLWQILTTRIVAHALDLQGASFITDFVHHSNAIQLLSLSRLIEALTQPLEFHSNTRKLLSALYLLQCADLYMVATPIGTSHFSHNDYKAP